jgi:asparagine synthase (glutamine-hydrolysing)
MCGIAGFTGGIVDPRAASVSLGAMCDAIRHRGPDDEGRYVADGVALGMRRLSIIDVACGQQPIANEDGSVRVVFNGEIYNHRELQRRLERAGHRFRTHSDTEVLVHLYEECGDEMLRELRGMFGFAIWDLRRERLFIARDRLGIKPLYYWATPDGLAFASELRSLLALDAFPRELDRVAIASYLALGYVPDPQSVFQDVRKLPPGHALSWTRAEGARVTAYWRPTDFRQRPVDEREAIEELRRLLGDAVDSHLESEVPLGAFLSGGIDSSTVVAEMTRRATGPVRTFAIGFDDPEFDESGDAARVAGELGTRHTQLVVRPDADRLVEQIARSFDEPFADSSALPTFLVAALARQQVTVALSGDGGDELFAGYTRYAEADAQSLLPTVARRVLRSAALLLPHVTPGRNRLLDLSRSASGRYAGQVARPLSPAEGGIARREVCDAGQSMDGLLAERFDEAMGFDFVTRLTAVDMATYLPGDILTKVDRTTMANSLEARVPLLDHHLVEFALALPDSLKLRAGRGKWILREAIRGLVPPSVLSKPKQGFAVPLRRWLRSELKHRVDALLPASARIYEFVDAGAVRRVVGEHAVGRRDYSDVLWRLIVLELWLGFLASGELACALPGSPAVDELLEETAIS